MRKHVTSYGVLLKRVENIIEGGTPDVHGGSNNVNRWAELKALEAEDIPKRPTTRLLSGAKRLNVEQENWHIDMRNVGNETYIIIGIGSHDAYVLTNKQVERINQYTFDQVKANAIVHVSQPEDWRNVARLFGAKV